MFKTHCKDDVMISVD